MTFSENIRINSKHKDRLFRLIFGNEEYMENNLALYNALNGTNYTDPSAITITTIDDFIYMDMKNDASILIYGDMPVWEQQSTHNPNMPLRGMIYYGMLYCGYIEAQGLNLYGHKQIRIPTPQYYVFYNGREKRPEREIMRLSDSFVNENGTEGYEWTANVININPGCNEKLLRDCKPLADYMYFVNEIRASVDAGLELKNAVDAAVMNCNRNGIMVNLLQKHEGEVKRMVFTEFDQEKYMKQVREEWMAEGIEQGVEQGIVQGQNELVTAIRMLKAGNPDSDILENGVSRQTLDLAKTIK